jgi:hypothetical protein
MGILELTPSIRADTEAFNKALRELGLTKTQFMRKLKRLGISGGDPYSKTNYLNKLLRDAGKPELQYKNVISKVKDALTSKGKVEVGMGGTTPGRVGAPENAKIWEDGRKVQKVAEKKFKNLADQRKFFVDTMKKLYKNVPKKEILNLFKNVIKGIKNFSPMGIMQELSMDMIEKNPEIMTLMPNLTGVYPEPEFYNKGGMMNINEMTRPIGMFLGGDPVQERKDMMLKAMTRKEGERRADMETGDSEMERMSTYGEMPESDIIQLALQIARQQGDTSEENIRKIMMQLSQTLPSLQQDMADERRSPISSGVASLIDMLGMNRRTNLDRNVSASRTR